MKGEKRKQRIYDGEMVQLYAREDFEIGMEADMANEVIDCALIGARQFALHLKEPLDFFYSFKDQVLIKLDSLEEELKEKSNNV